MFRPAQQLFLLLRWLRCSLFLLWLSSRYSRILFCSTWEPLYFQSSTPIWLLSTYLHFEDLRQLCSSSRQSPSEQSSMWSAITRLVVHHYSEEQTLHEILECEVSIETFAEKKCDVQCVMWNVKSVCFVFGRDLYRVNGPVRLRFVLFLISSIFEIVSQ